MRFCLIFFLNMMFSYYAFGNIIGSDHQNFNPANSIKDYVTVYSTKPLGKGHLSLGLHVNYAVNTLPYFNSDDESNIDTIKKYNNSLSGLDLNIAMGLTKYLDLNLAIPYVVHQDIKENTLYRGQFVKTGNTELRAGFKWTPVPLDVWGFAVVTTANYNRIINNPYTGDERWPAFSLELVGEMSFGPFSASVNLGHRWRRFGTVENENGESPIIPFKDQWIYSLGTAYQFPTSPLKLLAESYGSYTREDFSAVSPRNTSVAEGLVALRYEPTENLFIQAGVGAEMRHAISSADQRYFVGMSWAMAPFLKGKTKVVKVRKLESLPVKTKPDEVIVWDDVLFDFNSDQIRSHIEQDKLARLEAVLRSRNLEKLVVEGHACAIGTEVYNLDLSERRADAIVDWLVTRFGFPREKIIPVGFGEKRPAFINSSEHGRHRNRRVHFKIYYQP